VPGVVRFLSPEWVDALDRAAVAHCCECGPELAGLVVEYDVEGERYHLAFGADGVRAVFGGAEQPTVTFRCDHATARAISRAELSAQRAFMAGRLRIGGDAAALVRAQGAIARLPDLFAAVRAETEW
jgi:putative sterol carrier protein